MRTQKAKRVVRAGVALVVAVLGTAVISGSPEAKAQDQPPTVVEKDVLKTSARLPAEYIQYRVKDMRSGEIGYIYYDTPTVVTDLSGELTVMPEATIEPQPRLCWSTKIVMLEGGGIRIHLPKDAKKLTVSDNKNSLKIAEIVWEK